MVGTRFGLSTSTPEPVIGLGGVPDQRSEGPSLPCAKACFFFRWNFRMTPAGDRPAGSAEEGTTAGPRELGGFGGEGGWRREGGDLED